MQKKWTRLFLILIFSLACGISPLAPQTPPTANPADSTSLALTTIPLAVGYGVKNSWIEIYFTDPSNPLSSTKSGGIDAPLVAAIDSAKLSVDMAVYSLSLNSIRYALIRAHKRGVKVRLVMESDNMQRSDPQKIKEAGIPIIGDRRDGLMHDKFTVIDGAEVWAGGMNYTDSGTYEDNNVLIRIRSKKIADNYEKEFEEMFTDDKFGEDVLAETPYPVATVNGVEIETYFSPDDGVQDKLLNLINGAQSSIYFLAFSFTADKLGEAILHRADAGVKVAGVMDEDQIKSNVGTEFDAFNQRGLSVRIDGNPGQMHHKIMIIDREIVVVGSYNFTRSAEEKNDENLLVIHSPEIAEEFLKEFKRVYDRAK
ncbi:MAG: phospholipase D-like domain-containing protein [Anaerolineales bacterium]|nr:phospholipase D-like domain-containing protein [Anaerolineales bacterium]